MSKQYNSSKVYFPGLNALRFFAASTVVFRHVEQIKDFWHLPVYRNEFLNVATGMAVTFFFVLSGFLITFLLFKEKEDYRSIDVKKFYMRRILRVWPLYYFIVFLAFAVLPNLSAFFVPGLSNEIRTKLPYNLLFYMVLMPNVANMFQMLAVYANQLWSIGVEEQFYLFWPWLIKKRSQYSQLFYAIIIAFVLVRNGLAFGASHLHNQQLATVFGMLNGLVLMTRIDCMAIGGLVALYIYNKEQWFRKFFVNRTVEVASLALIVVLCYTGIYVPYIHHDFYAVVFSIFIVNVSCNPRSLFCLEGKVWTSLGNISYGIYMYHLVAIGSVLAIFRALHISAFPFRINLVLHLSSLLLTIVIAQLSYRYFETPFLSLKNRMTRVKSGSMTEEELTPATSEG